MKPWVKETIKSNKTAFLSIESNSEIEILPITYNYNFGRLITSFTILQAEFIYNLRKFPRHVLLIVDGETTVKLEVSAELKTHNLDENWKNYNLNRLDIDLRSQEELENYKIPHLNKQIIVEFIPSRITAQRDGEKVDYQMEIIV